MDRVTSALALLTALAGGAPAAENLAKNPSFEQQVKGGSAALHWSGPGGKGVRSALDRETAHSGKQSGRIEGLDAAQQSRFVQAWRQKVAIPQDKPLWLSCWVKAQDVTNGSVRVLHENAAGKVVLNQALTAFSGTFDWRELAGPIREKTGAVKLTIVIGIQRSTGTAWLDDVSLVESAPAGELAGSFEVSPSEPQLANGVHAVTFIFTLGKRGLAKGGEIRLRWERWRPAREFRFTRVSARCDVPSVKLSATVPPPRKVWPHIPRPVACAVAHEDGPPLPKGAKVTLAARMRYSRQSNVLSSIRALIVPAASSAQLMMDGAHTFQSTGGKPARVTCVAMPRPVAGQPGRVTLAVTDAFGNPCAGFRGKVKLSCKVPTDLPKEYAFTERDAGSHTFTPAFPAGEVARVAATLGELDSQSNPILPRRPDEPGIYFGDIHSHCEISGDGVGDPDLAYEYARKFHGLDFAALSDHSPKGPRWKRLVEVTNRHSQPGRFVTILGSEWSSKAVGHRNAYYPGDEAPQQPAVKSNMKPWWDWLRQHKVRALIVPHHTNTESTAKYANGKSVWGPCDWSEIDHEYQRVVEICQNRGSFEAPGGPIKELRISRKDAGASVQTALALGHRLAFIGSTDTHNGRPGTGHARCAIVSPEFTRQGLWQAMYDRRCYATTGVHALVLFSVNGQPMGSEIQAAAAAPRKVTWRAIGTSPIKRVDLLRNNEVVKSWPGAGDDMAGEFLRDAKLEKTEWWYLRVIQQDTHLAWSSPVWVDPK